MKYNKLIPELDVSNIMVTIEFYKNIGFNEKYSRDEDKFVFLELEGSQFMMQEIAKECKWKTAELKYPYGRGINFQLEVTNIENIYKKSLENNYNIFEEIQENWYRNKNKLLGNKEFLLMDPDGYLLRFSEDIGEKEILD